MKEGQKFIFDAPHYLIHGTEGIFIREKNDSRFIVNSAFGEIAINAKFVSLGDDMIALCTNFFTDAALRSPTK